MNSSIVSAEVELRCFVRQYTIAPVAASFYYSREDPYAIRVDFHLDLDWPVEWTFARDLLSMGMVGCEGIGNVRVWPSAGPVGGAPGGVVNIELSSQSGQARFEAPAEEISDFVRRTWQIVPAGVESDHLNFEAELADLLRWGS
jgi:Streptomyces sporulation and cell division protein, SsgA